MEVPKEGTSSEYEDTSKSNRGVSNRDTDVPQGEFEENLEKSGYEKTKTSKDGKSNTYSNGKSSYTTRSNSGGRPTADYRKNPNGTGKADVKIRLKP